MEELSKNPNDTGATEILYLILKAFKKANSSQVCKCFMEDSNIEPWMQCLYKVLLMPIPDELVGLTEDVDEIMQRNRSVFWKIKGLAAKITWILFS